MTKWTEVSAYSGQPVEEDAPTNFAGAGSGVDMNPTGMRKKKKKLIDARTREYKAHQKRLETARQRREERKKVASKMNEELPFSQKVQEQIRGFDRESLLAEDTVDVLKSIVKNKAMKPIKLKDGTMKVDLFTASAIVKVLDKINPANKAKLTKMLNGKKSDFMRAADGIMRIVGKSR
jgi:hypothetical protein